jgi:hypothetical protein
MIHAAYIMASFAVRSKIFTSRRKRRSFIGKIEKNVNSYQYAKKEDGDEIAHYTIPASPEKAIHIMAATIRAIGLPTKDAGTSAVSRRSRMAEKI